MRPIFLLPILMALTLSTAQADLLREQEIAKDIAPSLAEGELIWLRTPKQSFWAIYRTTARKEAKGAAIIVPDSNDNPASTYLVAPLVASLRQTGWEVLALQPSMDGMAAFDAISLQETAARLDAGLKFVQGKKQVNVALLGIGRGALVVLDYAAGHPMPRPPNPPGSVKLVGLIDLPLSYPGNGKKRVTEVLSKVALPVADYYLLPEQASEKREQAANQRRIAAKDNSGYRQLRFTDLDPVMWSEPNMLVQRLVGWLGNTMSSQVAKLAP